MLACFVLIIMRRFSTIFIRYDTIWMKDPQITQREKGLIPGHGMTEANLRYRDVMVMTIYSESVTLRSEGKCMSIQGLNPYTVSKTRKADAVGITITASSMTPPICHSFLAVLGACSGKPLLRECITSGTARCGYETFTLHSPKSMNGVKEYWLLHEQYGHR